jgi:hypothetical protein
VCVCTGTPLYMYGASTYIVVCISHGGGSTQEIRAVFDQFDADGSGTIDTKELKVHIIPTHLWFPSRPVLPDYCGCEGD